MDARTVELIERGMERGASTAFGTASGYAAYAFASGELPQAVSMGAAALTLFVASIACNRLLSLIGAEECHYDLAAFETPEVEIEAQQSEADADEPLELDDVLAEPAPDSRVVRMFAPEAMPTHIDTGAELADASQDLYQALAELRRSLR